MKENIYENEELVHPFSQNLYGACIILGYYHITHQIH